MDKHIAISPLVGLDEVGRGALAGPVVAGCCAFITEPQYKVVVRPGGLSVFVIKGDEILITDSKKMTAGQRETAAEWIFENASCGIGEGNVEKINEEGIVPAANEAFREAFKKSQENLSTKVTDVLIDALYIPNLGIAKENQHP